MRYATRVLISLILPAFAFAACTGSTTDPDADDVVVVVATTGGILAMDWQVTLNGDGPKLPVPLQQALAMFIMGESPLEAAH